MINGLEHSFVVIPRILYFPQFISNNSMQKFPVVIVNQVFKMYLKKRATLLAYN